MIRILLLALALLLPIPAWTADGAGDGLLIAFHRDSGELALRDPEPRVKVYASGRVEIYRAAYLRDSGRYELHLTPDELAVLSEVFDGLLGTVTSEDLAEQVHHEEARRRAAGHYAYTSDETLTRIHFVRAPGDEKVYRVTNLQSKSKRFPQLGDLATLADTEGRLMALADRTDGRRIGNARSLDTLDGGR